MHCPIAMECINQSDANWVSLENVGFAIHRNILENKKGIVLLTFLVLSW